MVTAVINLLPVIFFSTMAFWKWNAPLFIVAAGASIVLGFFWYDAFPTNLGLGMSLMIILYSLVCLGFAFACIFKRRERTDA